MGTTSTPLWSDSVVLARSLLSCIAGSLSAIGSAGIIYLIVSDWKKNIAKVRNRILLGLSIFDVILSVALALATLPVPKGTPYAAWAMGNSGTCTAQGFFVQLGLASLLYNGSLAIYHLLVIHYEKQEKWIQHSVERYLHIIPISFCFITATIGAVLDQFHYSGNICYLASLPHQCHVQEDVDCIKGENTILYRGIFAVPPVLLSFMIVVFSMGRVVLGVYRQEKKLKQYDFERRIRMQSLQSSGSATASSETTRSTRSLMSSYLSSRSLPTAQLKRTRETFIQALLYSGSFFIVIIFQLIALIIESTNKNGYIPFGITALNYFFRPLQGFFNFLVFIRPNFAKKKRQKRRTNTSIEAQQKNEITPESFSCEVVSEN